jgi:hypothetical protein
MFNISGGSARVAGADTYLVQRSLRFRQGATANLTRTFAANGNTKVMTWSCWAKRSILGVAYNDIFSSGASGGSGDEIGWKQDAFHMQSPATGSFLTTALFRDPSAWYHLVVAMDTSQATNTNRLKVYVNGVQITSFQSITYPSLNAVSTLFNTTTQQMIGAGYNANGGSLDGYLAEINFIDGQQLTPSSFGALNADTGAWRAKAYTGTYGTNGYYLNFADNSALTTSSNVGLGKDNSGNANYWATNNISITAGSTYDSMTDVPTNTSITAGNYSTLNPLWKGSVVTLTNGNLSYSATGATNSIAYSTYGMTSGKWYAEWTQGTTPAGGAMYVGISLDSINPNHSWLGQNAGEYSYLNSNGFKANSNTQTSYGATWGINDVIGIAFDADARTITFYKNGVSQGVAYSSIPAGTYYFANGNNPASTVTGHWNFGQRPFTALPTGFSAVNTFNIASSTILKANTVMDATLYTGNGTTQTITNAAGFRPDLVWFKERSSNSSHWLFDTIRGVLNRLSSNETVAEANQSGTLTAFNSNGFSVGSDVASNESGITYVGWQWQANESTVTNTSGTISSQVRVNTTAGFSIVTWTGTGSNATVGHGLGVDPKVVISRKRNGTSDWAFWITGFTGTQFLEMNTTGAILTGATVWNSTTPTSTVFSVGSATQTNNSGGTYVAYLWSEIAGFSKFGSYTGNGSTDGPFVYLGFRPKFVLLKVTSAANDWGMYDSTRNPSNLAGLVLRPNANSAEVSASNIDFLSNGFKLRNNGATTEYNGNGSTYIYMAFAENPFKNSNAR